MPTLRQPSVHFGTMAFDRFVTSFVDVHEFTPQEVGAVGFP